MPSTSDTQNSSRIDTSFPNDTQRNIINLCINNDNDVMQSSNIDLNKSFYLNSGIRTKVSINDQINDYRINKHNKLLKKQHLDALQNNIPELTVQNNILSDNDVILNKDIPVAENYTIHNTGNRVTNDIKLWPKNTVLFAGDSILNGIDETRLSKTLNVKVRPFPWAYVDDMYDYLSPL